MFNTNITTYKKISGILVFLVLVFVVIVYRYLTSTQIWDGSLPVPLPDGNRNDIQVASSMKSMFWEHLFDSKSACELPGFKTIDQCQQINKQGGPCSYVCQCYTYRSIVMHRKYTEPLLLPKQDIVNIEATTLHDLDILNITDSPSVRMSTLSFLNPNQKLVVGDTFKVVVQMLDRAGRPRRVGGDEVRIWMVSANKDAGLKVVGDVVDFSNGTYVATITALWEGRSVIYAKIEHPREEIATRLKWQRQYRTLFYHGGIFTKSGLMEETICSFFRLKAEVCNFTMLNGGLPWYCEKPSNPKLNCTDIERFHERGYPPIPLTETQKELTQVRKPHEKLMTTKLTVDIGKGVVRRPQVNCNRLKKSQTWDTRMPTGYMNGSHWISLKCNNTLNIASLRSCLKNISLIFSGDSTTRQYYQYLISYIVPDCTQVTKNWTTPKWHEPSKCVSKTRNLTIIWNPHELPFSHAKRKGKGTDLTSAVKILNGLDSSENVVFVIHYYCHSILNHYTVLIHKLRILKDGIKKVLMRNKKVKIFIKSPYAFDVQDCKIQLSDLSGPVYIEIIKRELQEFKDSIVYLNIWEVSVAMENKVIHPNDKVLWEHIRMLFGYICK